MTGHLVQRREVMDTACDMRELGIRHADSKAMRQFSAGHGVHLIVRRGKENAVPWLERGYPSKPMEIKAKVDAVSGFVMVSRGPDRDAILNAGYLVLEECAMQWCVADRCGPRPEVPFKTWWCRRGLVTAMHPTRNKPVTSDYDLAAVLDARKFNYIGAFGRSDSSIALTGDRTKNLTNSIYERAVRALNDALENGGGDRIMHGPQCLQSATLTNEGASNERSVVAFVPSGKAYECTFAPGRLHAQLADYLSEVMRMPVSWS